LKTPHGNRLFRASQAQETKPGEQDRELFRAAIHTIPCQFRSNNGRCIELKQRLIRFQTTAAFFPNNVWL
jgi:hypothetical protein